MTAGVVGVLAEALAKHQPVALGLCWCGWSADPEDWEEWRGMHCAHQASVVAALPDIAIIELPEPDTNDRIQHWKVGDISVFPGTGLVWADLEPTVHNREAARIVAANLLSAARSAGGQA